MVEVKNKLKQESKPIPFVWPKTTYSKCYAYP